MNKNVLVKRLHRNVYDAFWDDGWLVWTRILYKKGEVIYIKGKPISADDTAQLKQLLDLA